MRAGSQSNSERLGSLPALRLCLAAAVVIAAALVAAPASANVQFTKQWAGTPEFDQPSGAAVDSAGNTYVSDANNERIVEVDTDGVIVRTWGSFGTGEGKFKGPAGVALDSSGNVYVADLSNHRIQEFSSTGTFIRTWGWGVADGSSAFQSCTSGCQAGIQGSGDGQFNLPRDVAFDASGNMYVVDSGNNRIQQFDNTASRNFVTKWGTSGSGIGQLSSPYAIDIDSSGNVYVADMGNNRIEEFDTSGTYQAVWGSPGTIEGQFTNPRGVAVDSVGNVYVSDSGNNRIQKFNSSHTFVSAWGWGVDDGIATYEVCTSTCQAGLAGTSVGQIWFPIGIATDSSDNVYAVENSGNRVEVFDSTGNTFVNRFGGPGSNGQLEGPAGLASDSSGNVYLTDTPADRFMKFNPDGVRLQIFGTPGTDQGQVTAPRDVAIDSAGNTYVVDTGNQRVEKFDVTGQFVVMWGNGVNSTTGGDVCDGSGGEVCGAGVTGSGPGEFNEPSGVAVDSSGSVYVTDVNNNRVQKFSSAGIYAAELSGAGTGSGQFQAPTGVTTDSAGNVYVADGGNQRIEKFDSSGSFLLMWGNGVNVTTGGDLCTAASGDVCGQGSTGTGNGEFNVLDYLATDSNDNVYVPDCARNDVQVFRPTSVFVKKWGSSGSGAGEFDCPADAATRGATIQVSDFSNKRVQKFTETDTTAPDTSLTGGPSGTTNDPTPTFSFSSSEPSGALFECRIDGASPNDYKPCSSPLTVPHLADGAHTLQVRTIDAAGNVDGTPSSRSFMVKTAAVAISGSTLMVTAAPGAADNFRVSLPVAGTLRVTDVPSGSFTGSGVHTGGGCTRSGDFMANCNSAGITLIKVSAGGLGDRVLNSTALKASFLGGPGADVLTGGPGIDVLTGGTGADVMKGMNGNDKLFARDLATDTSINCDGGTTPGTNDSADLDTVGIDPPAIVHGCERLTRH